MTVDVPVKFLTYRNSIYGWVMKLCQKIQNGGCRYHELLFGNPGPQSLLHDRKYVLKFHVNRVMAIWMFCKFGKTPIPTPNIFFLGVLTPKHYSSSSRPPKGTSLAKTMPRILSHLTSQSVQRSHRDRVQRIQKRGRPWWGDKLGIGPAHTLNQHLNIFGTWGRPLDVFLKLESRVSRSPNFGATGGQISLLPIDKTHRTSCDTFCNV